MTKSAGEKEWEPKKRFTFSPWVPIPGAPSEPRKPIGPGSP